MEPKENLRYLGVELCRKLGYKKHVQTAAAKTGATAVALGRILPNVGGAKQRTRKLLTTATQNQLLYAAPIWAKALTFQNNVKTLERPQRMMAYRTVSTNAILVVAGIIPAHLVALESQTRYTEQRNGTVIDKKVAREMTMKKWQAKWDATDKELWTRRLIGDISKWTSRKFGNCDFHLTQMLTGHGCFGQYLYKYKRREDPACVDCGTAMDDAEHTLFKCDRWWRERRKLEVAIGADMVPDTIVKKMLGERASWKAVKTFVGIALPRKEEEERQKQRATVAANN